VGDAMAFYQKQGDYQMQDADATIAFVKRLNRMFDILNAKLPVEALRLNSSNWMVHNSVKTAELLLLTIVKVQYYLISSIINVFAYPLFHLTVHYAKVMHRKCTEIVFENLILVNLPKK
jgi:2-hydroxy-3-keto-5-methylthiopentenyl-1-phosphate phosphatase